MTQALDQGPLQMSILCPRILLWGAGEVSVMDTSLVQLVPAHQLEEFLGSFIHCVGTNKEKSGHSLKPAQLALSDSTKLPQKDLSHKNLTETWNF